MKGIIFGFMASTAFLSMWISNTATSVMMLPIGIAIVHQIRGFDIDQATLMRFSKGLMLAIAYSASVGGVSTLIGTPPNLVLAGVVQELYNYEISFAQWMLFGFPISMVLLFITWYYLTSIAYPMKKMQLPGGKTAIQEALLDLGGMSYAEKIVAVVFACTALAWITRKYVLEQFLPGIDDTVIAIAGGLVLFLLPSRNDEFPRLIDWKSAVKLPWGIILLFGGGMSLAEGFKSSGLAQWIGEQMASLQGIDFIFILLVIVASVNFLTEMTSNLATTSMLLPVLAPMAVVLDVHPFALMVGATVAASCAFMLPVATPPNAVVFGSGYLRIPDMVKAGIWLNLISILFVTIVVYFLLSLIWGIDLGTFPAEFR